LVTRINKRLRAEGAPAATLLPADLSPHDLRHTALTDLAAHGEAKAVQNIAGHADIDTTMRVYAGRRMSAMRTAVEAVEKARKTG
jgi:integrase